MRQQGLYETDFRSQDPQLGRFWQIDPLGELNESWSLYSYVQDNPVLYNDPIGLDTVKSVVKPPSGAQPGQEVSVTNRGGGKSNYIYDPKSPNADPTGMVANGMVDPTLQEVVVTPSSAANSNDEEQDEDSSQPPPSPAPTPAPKPTPSPAPAPKWSPPKSAHLTPSPSKELYLDIAIRKYSNKKYTQKTLSEDEMDCSGIVCLATGHPGPTHFWDTHRSTPPPGDWTRIYPTQSSYDRWLSQLKRGDLFIWRGDHTGWYYGDGRMFGAHRPGKLSGPSKDGYELKSYWVEPHGYPEVWRQN